MVSVLIAGETWIDIEALLNTENERRDIEDYKEKLFRERARFRDEMDMLNHRIEWCE